MAATGICWSVFPKQFQHLSAAALAATMARLGFDGVNAVIRAGYWCTDEDLASSLSSYLAVLRAEGLSCPLATCPWSAAQLAADDRPFAELAEQGIRLARIDWWRRGTGESPAAAYERLRREAAALVEVCLRRGVRALIQVHHGTLIQNSFAAWSLLGELPSAALGIELDPGNQSHEGWESWDQAVDLLGAHLAAWGIKDSALHQDVARVAEPGKGWHRDWVTCDRGVVDWRRVFSAAQAGGFAGPLVLMPFYAMPDPDVALADLGRELGYLRRIAAASGLGQRSS